MDSLSRAGGHYTVTAEPYGEHWLLCSRLLVLLQIDERFDLIPKGWKVKRWARPSEDDVVSAVARAGRYPSGLLLGDVGRAAEVVKAREGLKLSNYLGAFRGGKAAARATASARAGRPGKAKKAPQPQPSPPQPVQPVQPLQPGLQPQSGRPAPKKYKVPTWYNGE